MASKETETVLSQVRTGDRRLALEALRDRVAATIDSTESGRDMAALSKRLIEIMAEIDALPDSDAADNPLEAARRSARR